jgi:hypothetical protein
MEALVLSKVQGVPSRRRVTRSRWNRFLNACIGLTGIGLALFLVAGFGPYWWACVAAGILLAIVWLCEEPGEKAGIGYRA